MRTTAITMQDDAVVVLHLVASRVVQLADCAVSMQLASQTARSRRREISECSGAAGKERRRSCLRFGFVPLRTASASRIASQ